MGTLYTSIKDDLLVKIKNGTYAEGDVIPSEVDLAKAYGVSRPTIRQALSILANEGYLDRRKRRGTVVANPNAEARRHVAPDFGSHTMRGVQSFEDEITWTGKKVETMPIMVKEEPATEEVAKALDIEVGASTYKLVRLRYVDGVPNMFCENYIRADLYPDLIEGVDFSKVRLYARLREAGRPIRMLYRRIDVIKADSSIAMLLDVSVGDPMFFLTTSGRDAQGNVVEYSVSTYRGDANTFEFSVADPGFYPQDEDESLIG